MFRKWMSSWTTDAENKRFNPDLEGLILDSLVIFTEKTEKNSRLKEK